MQVFKVYFKVIQKNIPSMMIYLCVFIFFAVMLSIMGANNLSTGFNETKRPIAIFNYDEDTPLTEGLKNYLSENAVIREIADDPEKLQDALFFRRVEYIVKIPKGFTRDFMEGKEARIDKIVVPDSISAFYMDYIINRYLNTAKLYSGNMNGINEAQVVEYTRRDLDLDAEVEVRTYNGKAADHSNVRYFFNYLAYTMFSIMILAVTSIMMTFNKLDLKRRNLCAPVRPEGISIQLILGNLCFAVVAWILIMLAGLVIYREKMFAHNVIYMCINSFIFTFVCLSISFFISIFVKSRNAQSAVANVVSLGMCFISGVFVPQELLGKTVLKISSFTPTYWYIKANNEIASLVQFNYENIMPIVNSILIQLGFGVAVLSITLVISRQKRLEEA